MSYTVYLGIDNKTTETLTVVEKTVWYYANGGTWTENNGVHQLSMGGSGTSGILRIKSSTGELFSVILGVHNWAPWADVQVDLGNSDTGVKLHPQYYSGGRLSGEAHAGIARTSSKGRKVEILFDSVEDRQLSAVLEYS